MIYEQKFLVTLKWPATILMLALKISFALFDSVLITGFGALTMRHTLRKSARDMQTTYSKSNNNIIIPRRKAGESMRSDSSPVVITAKTLENFYCMPLKEAASRLVNESFAIDVPC